MAQKLSNLANKSKVKFGSLYGSPIVWIVADKNHAGYPSNSVTLVTNQIIKMLCFDATEPSNGNSDRRGYGNNRYIYSNLRQWLNSPAAAGQWYTAQHSADQTPDSSHVWNGVNPYSGLAGFLNAFTANERAALLNTTITRSARAPQTAAGRRPARTRSSPCPARRSARSATTSAAASWRSSATTTAASPP